MNITVHYDLHDAAFLCRAQRVALPHWIPRSEVQGEHTLDPASRFHVRSTSTLEFVVLPSCASVAAREAAQSTPSDSLSTRAHAHRMRGLTTRKRHAAQLPAERLRYMLDRGSLCSECTHARRLIVSRRTQPLQAFVKSETRDVGATHACSRLMVQPKLQ